MAKPMTADQTIAAYKKWGVNFKEFPGWRTRTRPGGLTEVYGILEHHTGGSGQSDAYLKFLFVTGRPEDGIPGPLCNEATDTKGVLHLGAIGRANHAGSGSQATMNHVKAEDYNGYAAELRPGPDGVNGNPHYYGNELMYTGLVAPSLAMYQTAVRAAAARCDFHGWSALSAIGHREHTRRKSDPGKFTMTKFRTDVAALLKQGPNPNPVAGEPMSTDTTYAHVHAKACALKLEEAMVSLGMTPPNRPEVTGEGDDYYAHYWAKYSHYLADLVAAKVAPAPKA